MPMPLRDAVMASLPNMSEFYTRWKGPMRKAATLGLCCRYSIDRGRSSRRVTQVNVDDLVKKWCDCLAAMCVAHTKDDYDAQDAKSDELLGPILTARVKQIREFYAKLLEALEADARIPFIVRMGFEAWGTAVVKDAPDEGIKRLKNSLAREIADLVELDVRDQIPQAIQRALRWRSPEQLEAVKEQLEAGARPRLRGRESCLFLEVGRGKRKVSVML